MSSVVGWVQLSPDALRRMRRELEGMDPEGVVDELGLLAVHGGYANRFFPGTSVLHTRPRYLFFTCYNYLWLSRRKETPPAARARSLKTDAERWVTKRLLRVSQDGIIGGTIYPRAPRQPTDFIYWTALKEWGFYRGPERATLLNHWNRYRVEHIDRNTAQRDDVVIPEHAAWFHVPRVPRNWGGSRSHGKLTLELTLEEAAFLRDRLASLSPSCLLSVSARFLTPDYTPAEAVWSDVLIRRAARELDQGSMLERARAAAHLAELARGVYAALVEKACNETSTAKRDDAAQDGYRKRLVGLVRGQSASLRLAMALSMELLSDDIPGLSPDLLELLSYLQHRLGRISRGSAPGRLLLDKGTYRRFKQVEVRRKGRRARLPRTPLGAERRAGLGQAYSLSVYPLSYRWSVVRTLLADLRHGLYGS